MMLVRNPGLLSEHTLICASLPLMFITTFGENHVRKQDGERETGHEWGIFVAIEEPFDGPWIAKKASLDSNTSLCDVITDGSLSSIVAPWSFSSFCFSSVWRVSWRILMYFTASSIMLDLSACTRAKYRLRFWTLKFRKFNFSHWYRK